MELEIDIRETVIQTFEFIWLIIVGLYDYCWSFCKLFIPTVPKSIKEDIILVTGGASGIGKEVCFELIKKGARTLVIWDFNGTENEKTASELRAMGVLVYPYEVDVSDKDKVSQAAQRVREEVGEVTILYNNAGITYIGNFLDINHDQIEKTVRINLLSHFWTLKEFLPAMVERKRGHIVTMCSTLGLKGVRTGSAYAASKFGVRGYLGCLESEIRNHPAKPDIKFTTIYPFFVKTPLIRGLKVTYRLGFLFEHLSPRHVATRVVDGILANSHSVYIPRHLPYMLFLEHLGPRKTAERVMDFLIKDIKLCSTTTEIASNSESKFTKTIKEKLNAIQESSKFGLL